MTGVRSPVAFACLLAGCLLGSARAERSVTSFVASGNAFTRVTLDGVDLGVRAWEPFAWDVPRRLAGRGRKLEIRVYTSYVPLFGDPNAPGASWKRSFWQPPRTTASAPGLLSVGWRYERAPAKASPLISTSRNAI